MNRLWIVFIVVICLVLFLPCLAFADSISVTGEWRVDDYIIGTNFGPEGGAAKMLLEITNTSSTETIKYVSLSIAPGRDSNANLIKDVNIPPMETRGVEFYFMIQESDVNVPVQAQVAMSQGTQTEVDGWGFVNGVVFDVTNYYIETTLSTGNATIEQGDDIDIAVDIDYRGNRDVRLSIFDQDGNFVKSYDDVKPDDTMRFYTHHNDLAETTILQYTVKLYSIDGVGTFIMDVKSNELTITVNPPRAINCDFDINLTADKTSIEAGENVDFSISIINTGDGIEQFEITDMDAMTISRLEGLASGRSGSAPITQSFDETQDVSFVVVAIIGDIQKAKQTNVIRITVGNLEEEEPIPTLEQIETPAIQHDVEQTPETTITEDDNVNQDEQELVTVQSDITPVSNHTDTLTIVLVVVIGLLLVTIVILVYLVVDRKREEARRNNFR